MRAQASNEELRSETDSVDKGLAKRVKEQGDATLVLGERFNRDDQLQLLWRCGALAPIGRHCLPYGCLHICLQRQDGFVLELERRPLQVERLLHDTRGPNTQYE